MKPTPFLLIQENTIKAYGGVMPQQGSPGFWLVRFEGPGKKYTKLLPSAALVEFTLFANEAERDEFVAPPVPPASIEPPKAPEPLAEPAQKQKKIDEQTDVLRREFDEARKRMEEKARKEVAPPNEVLLDSPPQVPSGN